LAQVIQDILHKQGEPNGYIVGREVGGAFAVGLRYGSGTLYHKIEGEQPVYWTGPSIGFDAGRTPARPSCWFITSTIPETCFTVSVRVKGRPIWLAGSTFPICGAVMWC
jgi:hypothetical protein